MKDEKKKLHTVVVPRGTVADEEQAIMKVDEKKKVHKAVVPRGTVADAIRGHNYEDIRIGDKCIRHIAKDKIHNRIQTRFKGNRCIGLAGISHTMPRETKRLAGVRVDPVSREIMSWKKFCAKNSQADDLKKKQNGAHCRGFE